MAEVGGSREVVLRICVQAPTDGQVITVRKSMLLDLRPPHTFINLAASQTHLEGIHRKKKKLEFQQYVQQVVKACPNEQTMLFIKRKNSSLVKYYCQQA